MQFTGDPKFPPKIWNNFPGFQTSKICRPVMQFTGISNNFQDFKNEFLYNQTYKNHQISNAIYREFKYLPGYPTFFPGLKNMQNFQTPNAIYLIILSNYLNLLSNCEDKHTLQNSNAIYREFKYFTTFQTWFLVQSDIKNLQNLNEYYQEYK